MKLKTQKRAAVATVVLAGVVGLGYGVTHLFNSASTETPTPVVVQQPTPVNPAPYYPSQPSNAEKQAVLEALAANDKAGLESHGYVVVGLSPPFGATCNNNGTTDGAGYQGNTTAISYDVSKNGQPGKACVSHDADGTSHVKFKLASNFAPSQQLSADQQQVVAGIEAGDTKRLGDKGISVTRVLPSFGLACRDDGTTDGTGYHGSNTAVAYEITRGGRTGKVCVAHDNIGTGSHATLKMD
jgi:hypothetical protein